MPWLQDIYLTDPTVILDAYSASKRRTLQQHQVPSGPVDEFIGQIIWAKA